MYYVELKMQYYSISQIVDSKLQIVDMIRRINERGDLVLSYSVEEIQNDDIIPSSQ